MGDGKIVANQKIGKGVVFVGGTKSTNQKIRVPGPKIEPGPGCPGFFQH
jgi:hypothetical protein